MTNIQLIEAQCRIEQVQTVLGFWAEGASPSNRDKLMIGAVICHCSMAYQKLFRKQTNCWEI